MAYNTKVVLIVKCILLLLLVYVALVYVSVPELYDRRLYSPPTPTKFPELKKILVWNDYYGHKNFKLEVGRTPFVKKRCRVDTCYITSNTDTFPIMEVDAVIWHGFSPNRTFPSQRSPHTRYIYYMAEAPSRHHNNLTLYKNVFNYTMTYRRDSDIPKPYGQYERRRIPLAKNNNNYAARKTKMAVWFVSNCNTTSRRSQLVKKLQQYLSVDIYGRCGPFTCPKTTQRQCLSKLNTHYRFYLAFENSLCKDYVTEKFFRTTDYNIIPVVYGMANYSAIAPPHSFINVLDFKTVKHLADYLIYLSHNNKAYNEYFRWRQNFKKAHFDPWCDLCAKLHSDKQVKTYDIYNWDEENKCVDSRSFSLKF